MIDKTMRYRAVNTAVAAVTIDFRKRWRSSRDERRFADPRAAISFEFSLLFLFLFLSSPPRSGLLFLEEEDCHVRRN
jgi:hypothetical protein